MKALPNRLPIPSEAVAYATLYRWYAPVVVVTVVVVVVVTVVVVLVVVIGVVV